MSRKPAAHVVVRLAPEMLKLQEKSCDRYKFVLERLVVEARTELRRDVAAGELTGYSIHGCMVERSAETLAQGGTSVAPNQPP